MTTHARRLLGLNLALLLALGVVTLITTAQSSAQPGVNQAGARPRGEYTLVSGRYQGSTTSAVYILDVANQELVALRWDRNSNRFQPLGFRSLKDDTTLYRGTR